MSSPLKRLREATDMSAYAFAKEAGIAGQYYYRLESGAVDMKVSTAKHIARVLGRLLKVMPSKALADMTEVDAEERIAA